jgi:hypothetical protein
MADAVSWIGAVSGLLAAWLGVSNRRRQGRLEQRATRSAVVSAKIEIREWRSGDRTLESTVLVLHNRGPAIAQDVNLELTSRDGQPVPQYDAGVFPLALDNGQTFPVTLHWSAATATLLEAHLKWSDDEGAHDKKVTLSMAGS